MKQRKKARHSIRRRQQVRRQLLLIGCVVFIVICAIGSCQVHKKRSEAKEAAKMEQQKEKTKKSKKNSEKKETPEEHLERVRTEAIRAEYPDGVIELLDKNPETVDFVENYKKEKDSEPAETIGDILQPGSIPLLLQWDERWGYAPYGTSIIAISGCGPTCLAMVASGLNQDPSITPAKVASFGTQNGYVDEDNNTYWSFMREAGASWNLSCYEGLLNETQVAAELSAGHPIICSVGPGNFTQIGHFIVLTGYENGSVTVNDPFSKTNSETLWNFSQIKDQIRAMWVYSLN